MIAVNCAFDKMVPLAELRPNPKNCNRHSEYQLGLLAKVMQAHGWRAPITVSNLSGLIIRGHGRLAAAQLAGETEAPVDFQDYASEQQEIEDMLADNRLSELAEMDDTALADLLKELQAQEVDLELAGYNEDELQRLLNQGGVLPTEQGQETEQPRLDELNKRLMTCPECGFEFKA